MSAIVSGLVAGAVAAALCLVAERRRRPVDVDRAGWRSLQPGRLMVTTIVGCCAMAALPIYILGTGGSTRPDVETQNLFAVLLAIGFACAAGYTSWAAYGQDVSWDNRMLRVRGAFGPTKTRRLENVVAIAIGDWSGLYRVSFNDGSTVRFSSQLRGARELSSLITDLMTEPRRKRP